MAATYRRVYAYTIVRVRYFACILQTKLEGRLELKTNPILASAWRGDTMLNNYFLPCVFTHAGKPSPQLRLYVSLAAKKGAVARIIHL